MTIQNYKVILFSCLLSFLSKSAFSQEKTISITIDDVPNTTKYHIDNFTPILLNVLDSLNVPFTLFINEEKIVKTAFQNRNRELLDQWIKSEHSIVGNHTYSHSRYSEVGFENFLNDIELGENLIKEYALKYDKDVKYFRFPFNDLGMDSIQHIQINDVLKSKKYIIAPFTIESSDWMFDFVYKHYLDEGDFEKASMIGALYVTKTLEVLHFFENMSYTLYNRPVNHIYLCHDNTINADYLDEIIFNFIKNGYQIVSFEESLTDPIYAQKDIYYKKWGISWLYRWIENEKDRSGWMKKEPDLRDINLMYEDILNTNRQK